MSDSPVFAPGRVLALENVHNFRDYGGYAVASGGRLKRGLLWRSGQHSDASDADLERINNLGLTAVYDLRSAIERTSQPCRRPDRFAARIVVCDEDTRGIAPHVAAARGRQRDAASMRETMRRSYMNIPFRPSLVSMMRIYLAELAELEGGSLINCMAGKDRTGFAVAMLHSALGVHRDDIIADYLLTNTAGNLDARIAAGATSVRGRMGDLADDALRVLMGVEAEYLETAFTSIHDKHGSVNGYLAEVLGVDGATKARLAERLVEA